MTLQPSRVFPLLPVLFVMTALSVRANDSDYGDFAKFPIASSEEEDKLRMGAKMDTDDERGLGGILVGLLRLLFAPDANAAADDASNSDDEDGVTLPSSIAQGQAVTISVQTFNDSGKTAYLNAWIDFNNDGALNDVLYTTAGGEKLMAQMTIPDKSPLTTRSINFVVPLSASAGTGRGMRVRLTDNSNPGPAGADGKGEVEDYVVNLTTPGFCYGIAEGELHQIDVATGAGTYLANMVIPGTGNALAFTKDLGADGVLVYSTGEHADMRLGVWDRATGANNDAGSIASFGGPSSGVIRSGAWYAGRYWFILDETDDLWKVTITGTSGNYRVTAATKVADIWNNSRSHGFGDFIVKPDGTMLAIANRNGGGTEFFTANLSIASPVASQIGSPPIYQNGLALGLDGKLYAGLGLNGNNEDWYVINQGNGTIISTVGASNLFLVSDMTLAAAYSAPALDPLLDYGDFSRFAAAGGLVTNNLRLGGVIDGENIAVTNLTATSDDTTGSDDEDGATLPAVISRGANLTIPVTVFNNTGASAYLSAWIDFNNDGLLNDTICTSPGGERLMNQITVAPGALSSSQNITFQVPSTASAGLARGVRVRLNSIGGQGPAGTTGFGEVEDYVVDIDSSSSVLDPYCGSSLFAMGAFVTGSGTTFTLSSSSSGVIGQVGVASGVTLAFTTGGITGPFLVHAPRTGTVGTVDDLPGSGGAALATTLQDLSSLRSQALGLATAAASMPTTQTLPLQTGSFTINATAPDGRNVILIDEVRLSSSATMTINGGPLDTFVINITKQMTFTGTSRIALTGGISPSRVMVNMLPGSTALSLTGTSASYNAFFVAVQSTNSVTAANASIITGGILAHRLTLTGGSQIIASSYQSCPLTDYSDHAGLPLTSSRTHPRLRLGAALDAENAAVPNATATGDDTTGIDDEDSATIPASIVSNASVTIPVTLLNNTGANAYLNAWIDFNGDGALDDTLVTSGGEKLMAEVPIPTAASSTTRNIIFTVPSAVTPGTGRGVRVRLTSVSNPGPINLTASGEVEDYATRIDTVGFSATMEVHPAGTAAWFANIAVPAGSRVEYRLTLTNTGTLALRDPVAVDILPAPGDTQAANTVPRSSAWRALLTGAATTPAGVNALYSLMPNPQRPEVLTPDPLGSKAPAWSVLPANPSTVSALKFDGTGLTLAGGSGLAITWTMAVPWDAAAMSTAWNSAGATMIRSDNGVRLPSIETARAAVQVLTAPGPFYGDTVWTDSNGDGLQTAGETGLNGVRVDFYRDNGDGLSDPWTDTWVDATFTTVISGLSGRYRFGQFPPGGYFATVSHADTWICSNADQGGNDAADSDVQSTIMGGRRIGIMPVTQIAAGESDLTWDAGLKDRSGTPAVWAVAETSDGRMMLGGRFAKSNGVARKNIVRVNANGTLDATFNPGTGFDNSVRSIALRSDGMIWVGGNFTTYNGNASRGVALLTATGAWDSRPAQPDTTEVNWVGASGTSMYLAGRFTRVGTVACGGVARLNANGSVDTAFNQGSGADGPIYGGAVLPNGGVILAGAFTRFHNNPSKGVVKLKADGKVDNTFNPGTGATGDVYSVKLIEDGRVILTGGFSSFDGTACNGAIRLTAAGKVDDTMKKSSLNVNTISTSN